MRAFVLIDQVDKDTMTAADKAKFTDVRIGHLEDGSCCVVLDFDDPVYFADWMQRVGGRPLGSSKKNVRADIEFKVGDVRDRVADAFKMCQFLLLAVLELYRTLTPSGVDQNVAAAVAAVESLWQNKGENKLFNLELKESFASEVQKLVNREADVTAILQEIGNVL